MVKFTDEWLRENGLNPDGTRMVKSNPKKSKVEKGSVVDPLMQWCGIYIKGNVPSSKNSRNFGVRKNADGSDRIKPNGKKDSFSVASKTVTAYEKFTSQAYQDNMMRFKRMLQDRKPPYRVYYKLIRKYAIKVNEDGKINGNRFDYHNMVQVIADQMVKHGWIDDDDAYNVEFIPVAYSVDKESSGVVIFV